MAVQEAINYKILKDRIATVLKSYSLPVADAGKLCAEILFMRYDYLCSLSEQFSYNKTSSFLKKIADSVDDKNPLKDYDMEARAIRSALIMSKETISCLIVNPKPTTLSADAFSSLERFIDWEYAPLYTLLFNHTCWESNEKDDNSEAEILYKIPQNYIPITIPLLKKINRLVSPTRDRILDIRSEYNKLWGNICTIIDASITMHKVISEEPQKYGSVKSKWEPLCDRAYEQYLHYLYDDTLCFSNIDKLYNGLSQYDSSILPLFYDTFVVFKYNIRKPYLTFQNRIIDEAINIMKQAIPLDKNSKNISDESVHSIYLMNNKLREMITLYSNCTNEIAKTSKSFFDNMIARFCNDSYTDEENIHPIYTFIESGLNEIFTADTEISFIPKKDSSDDLQKYKARSEYLELEKCITSLFIPDSIPILNNKSLYTFPYRHEQPFILR